LGVVKKDELRQEIDEAIARIDAKRATASPDEDVQLQEERAEWERERHSLDPQSP
jgi:hypothetical protein